MPCKRKGGCDCLSNNNVTTLDMIRCTHFSNSGTDPVPVNRFTTDKKQRKEMPIARGMLDYFPLACLAVANCSHVGNEQHNPGEPLHWAREKSTDQADCCIRHLMERGTRDADGVRHATKAAWRALALLQLEIEADGGKI